MQTTELSSYGKYGRLRRGDHRHPRDLPRAHDPHRLRRPSRRDPEGKDNQEVQTITTDPNSIGQYDEPTGDRRIPPPAAMRDDGGAGGL